MNALRYSLGLLVHNAFHFPQLDRTAAQNSVTVRIVAEHRVRDGGLAEKKKKTRLSTAFLKAVRPMNNTGWR